LGSGAGFPGLVIATLAAEHAPDMRVALVESDQRKAVFLTTVAQETGLQIAVHSERIDALPPQEADVVSARALAPLGDLLAYTEKHRRPGGIGLFPKGETVHNEIADAATRWRIEHKIHQSRTDPRAAIVEIGAIARA
jgi:16S rRNA (guanine527-N7)-methyltransferase